MRVLLPLLLLLAGLARAATPGPWVIDAELWAAPRSGQALVQMAPLREAVDALLRTPGSRLLIHYPGGESGQLWVQELRAWLIALGVPSTRIDLLPGGTRDDQLLLEVQS